MLVGSSTFGLRSRRDSSVSTASRVGKEQLAKTLDKIHTSASQSDALTTFNDFAPPPGGVPVAENKGTTGDLVQQGLSGLYSRFREAVGVGRPVSQEADDDDHTGGTKKTSSMANTSSRASTSSTPRGDSGGTSSVYKVSQSSDIPVSAISLAGIASEGSQYQAAQSSKASSIATMTASKTSSASTQPLPKVAKAVASTVANPTVAPVTVSAFKDSETSRGLTTRTEEQSRSRKNSTMPLELSPASNLPVTTSLDNISVTDRMRVPARSRRDDGLSADGSMDTPLSPIKASSEVRTSSVHSRLLAPGDTLRKPTVIDRIAYSRNSNHSRSSSMDLGVAEPTAVNTSAHDVVYHDSFVHNERPQKLQSGAMRISGTTTNQGAPEMVNAKLEGMKKQILSKEFWMADDTCKECFLCGNPFSAFRRKHHCRTCGCIFDSKCTSIIPGEKFGVSGSLRVCKTCLGIINRRYESESDDSPDESYLPVYFRTRQVETGASVPISKPDDDTSLAERSEYGDNSRTAATPMMAIPATRRPGETNRHSAILEIDMPQLSRPSSSRSLRSLAAGRPQSSGHRRHHSKNNLLNRFRTFTEERAPFRNSAQDELMRKSKLPAFHDDNIIDPDLAPYMSDESSGDEQMSIFSTINNDVQPSSLDHDSSNFGPFVSSGRKQRFRQGDKSVSGLSFTTRGHEEIAAHSNIALHARPTRRRNLSIASASVHHLRSPRPKSGIFKGASASADALLPFDHVGGSLEGPRKVRISEPSRRDDPPKPRMHALSLAHVKKLFRQMIEEAAIPNCPAWERALIPILIRCSDEVDLDVRRGDDMDIRHFVKFKKIAGGKSSDSAYVPGIVFTKNLALKSMPRKLFNGPRIVCISFAIEYQRQPRQHFMSLQPVIEQEKEYLRMVVNRIVALRPDVLLVQKSVSGVALQFLSEAQVAVAYNVKPSVIEAVSRIANTDIISSLDMLALPIRVGVSKSFEVKTFLNNDTTPPVKKTYIYITGTNEKLGCTIALRGSTTEILCRMKTITEFMVYVVYNAKLETCLLRDAYVSIPQEEVTTTKSTPNQSAPEFSAALAVKRTSDALITDEQVCDGGGTLADDVSMPRADDERSTDAKSQAADGQPPPAADEMKKGASMHTSHSQISPDGQVPEDIPMPTYYSDMVDKYETRLLSVSPLVKFSQPYLLMRTREQERRLVYLRRLRDQDNLEEQGESEKAQADRFQLIKPDMIDKFGQKAHRQVMEVIHAVHDAEYDKAMHTYQTQKRQWETNIQGSLDLFNPFSHQNIVVLHSMVCTSTKIPCIEPAVVTFEFYNQYSDEYMDPDCTLGQYVEDLCQGADSVCTVNGCYTPLSNHHRTYVHDQARITVFVERGTPVPPKFQAVKEEADKDGDIIMWSFCKFCKEDFGGFPMAQSTWKYSFGKFLELSFLGRGMALHSSSGCTHDHPKDHLRYFSYRDNMVRMHWDAIDLYEIIVPRARITWKVDNDLRLKNEIFAKVEERWKRFMESVRGRIKSIKIDTSVLPEKAERCKEEVEKLSKKAQEDQPQLIRNLRNIYMNSKYYEVIPLNGVVREMLEKAAEWDAAFAAFEADFLSDKDVRLLALLQLKKFFTDNESKESIAPSETPTSVPSESVEDKIPPTTNQRSTAEADETQSLQASQQQSQLSQPTDTLVGVASVPVTSPIETPADPGTTLLPTDPHQAAKILERVEPLDLASPPSPLTLRSPLLSQEPSGDSTTVPSERSTATITESLCPPTLVSLASPDPRPSLRDVSAPTDPEELSLSEKVERLRREHRATSHGICNAADVGGESQPEGHKAVPDRVPSRRTGLTVSPPIIRALTQPTSSLPRAQSSISRLLKESKGVDGGSEILQRVNTSESLKSDKKLPDRLAGALKTHRKPGPSGIPRYVHAATKRKESKVSTLARHFEQLSREFEKERIRDRKNRAAKVGSRAFLPRTSTKAIVEVYEDVDQAVQEPSPADDEPVGREKKPEEPNRQPATAPEDAAGQSSQASDAAQTEATHASGKTAEEAEADADADQPGESQAGSDDEGGGSDADQSSLFFDDVLSDVKEIADSLEPSGEIPEELPKHQKKSVINLLTNFWAERSASNWPSLDYPLNPSDHVFLDSDVIIREDEPSSVVAFALSSKDYQAKLASIRSQWDLPTQSMSDESDTGLEIKDSGKADALPHPRVNEKELERSLLRITGTHLKYQFFDRSAKMLCKVFYAEQFDALRQRCGVADRIIESLSRCLKWDSKGGKTKSVFLKTLDDRLVMKSLSPIETAAFLRFAPAYFSIMAEALFHDLPSVIAKMLGFFQVVIKNPDTGTEIKLDLLVMENLFYDRSPSRTFDLKGSMRNRRIQSTGEQNEVLLDENMVEYIYESPLFAREHAKRLLRASVWNDTLFLARQNVMDYSLMIAVDEAKKELVVGIIDCIRTYTWDKRLESWIKDRGFAGGGRNRPTVTSPKEYKSRFREAMARYVWSCCYRPI